MLDPIICTGVETQRSALIHGVLSQ